MLRYICLAGQHQVRDLVAGVHSGVGAAEADGDVVGAGVVPCKGEIS